jgi:septal ring factor EnvC (AmiA/AmiB activator)
VNTDDKIELFILKCATLRAAVDRSTPQKRAAFSTNEQETQIRSSIAQFSAEVRDDAEAMSEFYKLFYMLENDIRKLIEDTLSEAHKGPDWWDTYAPDTAKTECTLNQKREAEFGVTSRSDRELDYINFGQLGEIIRHNWQLFGGIVSNQKALTRVMHALNNLRGPIAHCGLLAEDEVDRLRLTVKDWFRLLEGPKSV